jgi:multidrug resistance efflux pump
MSSAPEKNIRQKLEFSKFLSTQYVERKTVNKLFIKILIGLFFLFIIFMFLPWTQNIEAKGYVTTLLPQHRPQSIMTVLPGRIEKWYVKEGDLVKTGDTIVVITETKSDYFDPKLLERTRSRLENKKGSVGSYEQKIVALDKQLEAFRQIKVLKTEQAYNKLKQSRLKVIADSNDLVAFEAQLDIAKKQLKRTSELHQQGIKSLTEVEQKKVKVQEMTAKVIAQENKFLTSKNEVLNARMEISNIEGEYNEKLAKTESEQFSALSNKFESEATVAKIENEFANYEMRRGYYVIRASQDGYVTKLKQAGLGQTVKEGEEILTLMPRDYSLAVEFYIDPIDYPLVHNDEEVRIQFDGWPAIFFSGWPNTSYGTFSGRVYAMDNYISENGKYRVLVEPWEKDKHWPKEVRVGGGAKTFVLLNDVPVWYELWRRLNAFPPDYYLPEKPMNKKPKK